MGHKDEIQLLLDLTFIDHEKIVSKRQSSIDLTKNLIKFPDHAGVIYWIDRTVSTFVIRAISSENLAIDYEIIKQNPADFPTLKLEEQSNINNLKYVEFSSPVEAEFVEQTVANRRIFKEEEFHCNISDQGYYWWLSYDEESITIYTQMNKIRNFDNLHRLGPIGVMDINKIRTVFNFDLFETLFPVKAFSFTSGTLYVKSEQEALYFRLFKNLILQGKTDQLFWKFLNDLKLKNNSIYESRIIQLSDFLKKYSTIRRFWKNIESQI
jgi:hypothetical protein